ncbi:MAG: SMC-Scp complex subunit ScpB [SAR324 cluster bacterium]|uniref:SMC-Scp complex subunit ScpB n=1 Tax=SAR324 cluster bacterium TaxID=2024889 RepID=A0A7X9FPC5_9DELT|nr:SMC-Scp complex subunit ScpB [SAR324 cluster bacterium]
MRDDSEIVNEEVITTDQNKQEELIEEVPAFESEEAKIAALEALIFANGEPISVERFCEILQCQAEDIEEALDALVQKYRSPEFGIELVLVGSKYQFRTKASLASYVRLLKDQKPRRLSPAALETLSIIAYRQPVTRHEIEKIRGVDPTPTLKTLLDKELVTLVGHKETVGQPGLYGTTDRFLHLFGLGSLAELPVLRELKQIESDPGESAISEELQEEDAAVEECDETASL